MRSLTASELIRVWETGQSGPPYRRAFLLLVAAGDGETEEDISSLSIGERDARLLTLREWTFGSDMNGVIVCPACGEQLEFDLRVADLHHPPPGQKDRLQLVVEDYVVDFRLPNSEDLMQVGRYPGHEDKQKVLLNRCVQKAHRQDTEIEPALLPAKVRQALDRQMAASDPQADIRLALSCQACDHHWQAVFDIVSYFWSEIHAWAIRMIRDIHLLASAYGWREADILSMSPYRRQIYLEMITN